MCGALVAPGGTFYLSEFHPFTNVFAWETLVVEYDYFGGTPFIDDEPGTYADLTAPTTHNRTYERSHPLGEIVTALINAGLRIELLAERPHTLFPRWKMLEQRADGTYWFPDGIPALPLMYSIRASRAAER